MAPSTTRYADPIAVPRLKQKLGALYLLSAGTDGDAQLGSRFKSAEEPEGLTGKAVRNWLYGEGKRSPGHVPANRFPRLVEIFRSEMPNGRSPAEVRAMLLAASELDTVLGFMPGTPKVEWITRVLGAAESDVLIVPAGPPGQFNVTTRRRAIERVDGRLSVPVGHPFRFELKGLSGYLAVVQWGRSGWFGLELDGGVVASGPVLGNVRLPSSPPYLDEDEPGARRYLFLRLQRPFPPDVEATLSASASSCAALDAAALVRLAHVLDGGEAEVSALDVTFVRPGGT